MAEANAVAKYPVVNVPKLEDLPSSSYYLHPNENPSLVLVSPVLSGSNYYSWCRSMKMTLQSKNKLQWVDGTFPAPAITDPTYSAWQICNIMVVSWLIHSVSQSIAQSIIWIDNAIDIWKDLKDHFAQSDSFIIVVLRQEIFAFNQEQLNVTDYLTQLKILRDE